MQTSQSDLELRSKALLISHYRYCLHGQIRAYSTCDAGEHKLRIGPNEVVSRDCRPLRKRDKRTYDALNDGTAGEQLIGVLDQFGIEVSRDTEKVLAEPTAHLSLFFDNYYIADDLGTVIFAHQPRPQPHDEDRRHRAGVPFASLATIEDLLVEHASSSLAPFQDPNANPKTVGPPTGHSMVRNIQVGDVDLSVFIHPFVTNGSTLYVVGVVLRSSLANEAIRIRLGPAVDALLTIAILLALLPVVRFWTSGDRAILRRFSLYSICGSVLGASALSVVLFSGMNFKVFEGEALDSRLESISGKIRNNFLEERKAVDEGLRRDLRAMEGCVGISARTTAGRDIEEQIVCPICRPNHSLSLWSPSPHLFGMADEWQPASKRTLAALWRNPFRLQWRQAPPPDHVLRDWWPTTSFLLDNKGRMEICRRYREDDRSLKLDLKFREYYKNADKDLRLYRIDSVVRGENQIVGSFKNTDARNRDGPVAVAIHKFWSIDGLVLPPSFQYAILDRDGSVIFHSDEDRNSVSNFIDDTGNDGGVQAAIAYRKGATLDLTYDGMPIRAHLMELSSDEGWTLVVFRSHALVDKVSSLASSLSIISWTATTAVILLIFSLLVVVPRPNGRRILSSAVRFSTDVRLGAFIGSIGIVGLAVSYLFGGGFSVLVGLLCPCVVGLVIFGLSWLRLMYGEEQVGKRLGRLGCLVSCPSERDPVLTSRSVWVAAVALALLVFSFSVVPMLAWQNYFRAQLSGGLVTHLQETAKDSLRAKVKVVREHAKEFTYSNQLDLEISSEEGLNACREDNEQLGSRLANGIVGFGDAPSTLIGDLLCREERPVDDPMGGGGDQWFFGTLSPLLAYSPVTWQAMWYKSKGVQRDVRSVSGAFDAVFGVPNDSGAGRWPRDVRWWLVVILGLALVLFFSYSAVRVKFGYARRVVRLCTFNGGKEALPERLLAIKRSDLEVLRLKDALGGCFSVRCLRWRDSNVEWEEHRVARSRCTVLQGSETEKKTVLFVEDFRDAMTCGARAHALATELAATGRDVRVIVCSDVVPLYHMDPGTVGDEDRVLPKLPGEWRDLLTGFHVRILRCDELAEWEEGVASDDQRNKEEVQGRFEAVCELLGLESPANVDSQRTIRKIAQQLSNEHTLSSVQSRERALREFRAAAQSRFKVLWAVSSLDERAQLYALAHGGSLNKARPAAISSLVNRGLITCTDPMQLYSEAFGQFIMDDVDDSLDEWRRKGHGDWWRITWLPLVLFAGLGLLFFINSNPEAIGALTAIGAVFIGLVPVITSLLRVGQVVPSTVPSSDQ